MQANIRVGGGNFSKKINNFFRNNDIVVPIALMIMVLFTSLGYSSLSTSFLVSGDAHFRVKKDIRITNIEMIGASNGGYETYSSIYYKDGTKVFTTLPNIDSTVTYQVELTNYSDKTYLLKKVTEVINSNENIKYVIEGIKVGSQIEADNKITFTIRVQYDESIKVIPDDITSIIDLNYEFELPDTTPPTVSFSVTGGVYNSKKDVTVTVSDDNFSYMNIQVNDGNGMVLLQNNITTANYTVTLEYESTWSVYVMAYDKNGNKQMTAPLNEYGWTYQTYVIDWSIPTVSFSLTGGTYSGTQNITVTATDPNFNYMNVQVNDSNGMVSVQYSIKSNTYTVNLGYESTWTVFVQAFDNAGNSQNTPPLNEYFWTYQTYVVTASCQRVSSCGCEILGDWKTSGSPYTRTYDASITNYMDKTVCTATSPTKTDYTCQNYVRYCLQYVCC